MPSHGFSSSCIHTAHPWFLRSFCIVFLHSNPISQPSDCTAAFQSHWVCRAANSAFLLCQAAQAGTGLPLWAQDELHSLPTQGPPKQAPQSPFPEKSHFSLSPPFYRNAFCHNPFLHVLVYKLLCYTMQRS